MPLCMAALPEGEILQFLIKKDNSHHVQNEITDTNI